MNVLFWVFTIWVGYVDGNIESFERSFRTQEECLVAYSLVDFQITEFNKQGGGIAARNMEECHPVNLIWAVDPRPLAPQSVPHN